jgi:hypothetical protein
MSNDETPHDRYRRLARECLEAANTMSDGRAKRAKADQGARLIDRHDGRPVSGEHQKGE